MAAGERADRELDRFVYHISHDLRASMRALTLVPSWIEEDLKEEFNDVPASIKEHVRVLTEQAQRLDGMMKDLLVYSRIGKEQTVEAVHLPTLLDSLLDELDPNGSLKLTRDLKVTELFGPAAEIKALLEQLILNLIKHAGDTAHLSTSKSREGVRLSLRDEGPGIDPKYHARIFELMTTLRPRDQVEGSGLGLAIARKIMTRLGGTLEVESEGVGHGAEFIASFPAT